MNYFSLGDYKTAVVSLEKASALAPEDAEIKSLLGTSQYLLGDFIAARDNLGKAKALFERSGDSSNVAEINGLIARIPEN